MEDSNVLRLEAAAADMLAGEARPWLKDQRGTEAAAAAASALLI